MSPWTPTPRTRWTWLDGVALAVLFAASIVASAWLVSTYQSSLSTGYSQTIHKIFRPTAE